MWKTVSLPVVAAGCFVFAGLMFFMGSRTAPEAPEPLLQEYKLPPVIYPHPEEARREAWVRFAAGRAALWADLKLVVRDADFLLEQMDQRDFAPKGEGDNGT